MLTQFNQGSLNRERYSELAKILNSARAQLQALNIRTDAVEIQSILYSAPGITSGPAQVPSEWIPFDIVIDNQTRPGFPVVRLLFSAEGQPSE